MTDQMLANWSSDIQSQREKIDLAIEKGPIKG